MAAGGPQLWAWALAWEPLAARGPAPGTGPLRPVPLVVGVPPGRAVATPVAGRRLAAPQQQGPAAVPPARAVFRGQAVFPERGLAVPQGQGPPLRAVPAGLAVPLRRAGRTAAPLRRPGAPLYRRPGPVPRAVQRNLRGAGGSGVGLLQPRGRGAARPANQSLPHYAGCSCGMAEGLPGCPRMRAALQRFAANRGKKRESG
ncbi:MAG: hypothetical protein QOD01_2672 [Actinomycetota bacterium]|nr:hypothetical protein [Actinomycetota bacterium]